jgi:hypothetical protein
MINAYQVDEEVKVSEEINDIVVVEIEPVVGKSRKVLKMSLHGTVLDGETVLGDVEGVEGADRGGSGYVDQQVFERKRPAQLRYLIAKQ